MPSLREFGEGLQRVGNAFGAGSENIVERKTALGRIAAMDERDALAAKEKKADAAAEQKRNDEWTKARRAPYLEELKKETANIEKNITWKERVVTTARMGFLMKAINSGAEKNGEPPFFTEEEVSSTIKTAFQRPRAQSDEKKKSEAYGTALDNTERGNATPESVQKANEIYRQTGDQNLAQKALVPKPSTAKDSGDFTLSPGGIRYDAQGKPLAENTNARFSSGRAGDKTDRVNRYAKAREEKQQVVYDNPDSLGALWGLTMADVDLRRADENISGSEAKSTREHLKRIGTAMTSFDSSAGEVLEILNTQNAAGEVVDNPRGAAITGAGDISRGFLSMIANLQGMTALISGVHPNVELDPGNYSNQLNKLAKDNATLRSALFAIALQNAVAQGLAQGGRLSNRSIELAIEDIGADVRSPTQVRNKLVEVRRRLAVALRNRLKQELGDVTQLDKAVEGVDFGGGSAPSESNFNRPSELEDLDSMDEAALQEEYDRNNRNLGR